MRMRRSRCADAIGRIVTRPWNLMEVCGGQTHAIVRFGLDEMLPDPLTLIHGPGCPVCVTPLEMIDKAIAIAARPDVIFCSYGDMLRVPGSRQDLLTVKSAGGDVRMVYSPLDAVAVARKSSRQTGGVLRHWFRDHRAGQCHGGRAGRTTRSGEFLGPGFSRARAPRDSGGARFAEKCGPGIPGCRPRVRRDGHRRISCRLSGSMARRLW